MAKICLPNDIAKKFKERLKSGDIDIARLATMSSRARNDFFKTIVGDEFSTMTNALFESKLLLKNQKRGMITWAKTVAGLKPEVRRDLLAKIERMQNVLTPQNADMFLKDLADTKLGVGVTEKEATDIVNLSKVATQAKERMEASPRRGDNGVPTQAEMEYGLANVELNDYVNDLKVKAGRISGMDLLFNPRKAVMEVSGIAKSLKSSLDVSATLRQGIKTVFSNPKEWASSVPKQFSDIAKVLRGKDAQKILNAEIVSDPMYDIMRKSKLAVGAIEEAFPTRSPEMIPLFGRFFKASDAAYSGFLHRLRFDLFKKYYKIAERNGVNINSPKELESIAILANSLTGRGKLPSSLEPSANTLNVLLFSPRNLQSHIDFLTGLQGRDVSSFAKKEAAKALFKTLVGTATVLATAGTLLGDDAIETDPRSSDFMKIRYKDTRFDVFGGMGSLMTLVARLATNSTKKSTTGKVVEFGKKESRWSALSQFIENKLSPIAQEIQDRLEGRTFDGGDPNIKNTLENLFVPLGVSNLRESKEEKDRANLLLIGIMDALGIGTSTY